MWRHLSCPHPWRLAGWSSYGLWIPCGAISHGVNALNLQIWWTLMTLMRKLTLNFGHFQIHDLVRAKMMGMGLPIILIAPGLNLGLPVVPSLILGTLAWGHVWASPIIQQLLEGLLVTETGLDYGSWMVLMQVEWSKGIQALLVWCIFQWWFGQSTASLHPCLPDWHWVGLLCQPSQWLPTMRTLCLAPHPGSVLLMITTHKTGQPDLGQSLQLLLSWICHLRPCLPQLVPARCVGVVVLFPIFSQGHLYFQTIPSLRQVRCWFPCWRLGWQTWWGATKSLWVFRAIPAALWCEGVAIGLDINSRLLII